MTRLIIRAAVLAFAIFLIQTKAHGQWIHAHWGDGHHHPFFGSPYCGSDLFVWREFIEVPVVETILMTPPIQAVPVAPAIRQPPAVAAILDAGENLARKEIWLRDRGVDDAPAVPGDNFHDAAEIRRRAAVLKSSSPEGRMRADRSVSRGDQAFAQQKLARATALYREAIAKAPDYAEPHFRLAHAYVATRQYNLALNSTLVALELCGSSRRDGFSLEDMYQGDQFPREQQLRRLVDASQREPNDGGLRFLIGFTLHYDGQRELAQDHFRAAQQLDGIHQPYVRYFLPVKPVAEPKEAAN